MGPAALVLHVTSPASRTRLEANVQYGSREDR